MTQKRKRKPPPPPPRGLTAANPNDWFQIWRRVRVQPKVDLKPWNGQGDPVQVTPAVKSVGLWAKEYADYDDGTRIHPGQKLLSEDTGWTEKTVGTALDAICRLGFLWRYVDGSKSGRAPKDCTSAASEYRLTVPDDILDGRVPLQRSDLPEEDGEDHPSSDQVMSVQAISDHLNSDPGSPELSSRITRTQFAPPCQDLVSDPVINRVSVVTTSVEGRQSGPRPVENGDLADFEEHRRQQQDALTAWIRDHPESA